MHLQSSLFIQVTRNNSKSSRLSATFSDIISIDINSHGFGGSAASASWREMSTADGPGALFIVGVRHLGCIGMGLGVVFCTPRY